MAAILNEETPTVESAFRLFQLGLLEEAVDIYQRIVKKERGNAGAWNMLGISLQRLGRVAESADAFNTAIEIAPRAPEVVVNLGNLYKESGNAATAIRHYRRALALMPRHAMAHSNLANCLLEMGEFDLAEAHAQLAMEIDGHSLESMSALANVAEHKYDFDKAIGILELAVNLFPDHVDLCVHLGCTYMMAKHFDAAIVVLRRALIMQPNFVEAMNNLGQALFELGRLEEADEILRAALEIRADMKEIYINLANVQIGQRRHSDALASFDRVFELDPQNASAHFVSGMVHLVEGDFVKGWSEYAWRWYLDKYRVLVSDLSAPEWCGECLKGKALFVHAEQGIGDTLHFVRYLPLLEKQGGKVYLEVQPSLKRLLSSIPNIDEILAKGEPLPDMDFRVPLLSIPGIMGTSLMTIPGHTPYLSVGALDAANWGARLDALGDGLKVGIAWAGNPDHANDHNRSMKLAQLAPWADIGGVHWFSLQKGPGAEQIDESSQKIELIDWTKDLGDFLDTAMLVEKLDLVIAVDTSIVHLAGALNKPVWVMIPYAPDWRWMLERSDSPWYPSMRLFRQSQRGNWDTVIESVAQELRLLTKSPSF